MMFRRLSSWLLVFSAIGLLIPEVSRAQQSEKDEIVIVNQDGEKVRELKVGVQEEESGSRFQIEGDRIVIIGADGKRQEIDISGAKSVQVQQSVETVDRGGESQTVQRGKAIIIGPDGERREIELGGPLQMSEDGGALLFDGEGDLKGLFRQLPRMQLDPNLRLPGALRAQMGAVGKFMVGVHCVPVPEALQSHLQLEAGNGLLVQSVVEDSPAAEAGLQQHDILIAADGQPLKTTEQLVEAVQAAGKAGSAMQMTGIRAGEEMSLSVTPRERPVGQALRPGIVPGPVELEFDEMGPGIILDREEGFRSEFQTMQEELRKLREELQNLRKRELGGGDRN